MTELILGIAFGAWAFYIVAKLLGYHRDIE